MENTHPEECFRVAQISGEYLSLPSEQEKREHIATFIDCTGNKALSQCVCIVCACELMQGEGQCEHLQASCI